MTHFTHDPGRNNLRFLKRERPRWRDPKTDAEWAGHIANILYRQHHNLSIDQCLAIGRMMVATKFDGVTWATCHFDIGAGGWRLDGKYHLPGEEPKGGAE